jgi:tRNA pseudouridine55 synthase
MDGLLVIDKPAGITSHDVVQRVRRLTGEKAVGHLGTLDPMATGVLPLLLGRMTRLARFYLGTEKEYEGEIRFGFATDTYDAQGEQMGPSRPVSVSLDRIRQAAAAFVGTIEQLPPPFSAKKVAGVPAYKLARKREQVALQPVMVHVKAFEIVSLSEEGAAFRATVGAGTYLRSIAHDLGQALSCGGHLARLRRTRVGEFGLDQAHLLEGLSREVKRPITDIMSSNENPAYLLHPRSILPSFPAVTAPPDVLPRLLNGNPVNLPEFSAAKLVKVFQGQRELVAIAQRIAGTLFQPKVVLAGSEARLNPASTPV